MAASPPVVVSLQFFDVDYKIGVVWVRLIYNMIARSIRICTSQHTYDCLEYWSGLQIVAQPTSLLGSDPTLSIFVFIRSSICKQICVSQSRSEANTYGSISLSCHLANHISTNLVFCSPAYNSASEIYAASDQFCPNPSSP